MKNITRKLAALSFILTGSIAIIPNQAQAIMLTAGSTLGWTDTTNNFFPDYNPGTGDTVDILFNTNANTIVVTSTFKDFTSHFTTGPVSMDNAPQSATLNYVSGIGTELNPAIYALDSDLIMSFDPAPNSTGNPNNSTEYDWVVPAGTRLESFRPSRNSVQFSLCDTCGTRPFMEVDGMVNLGFNTFQFSDTATTASGNYTVNYEAVPEPMTILGSVTALGFGTILKRQKNKKISN